MKTHKVINLNSHPDESNIIFVGSSYECQNFKEHTEKIQKSFKFSLDIKNLSAVEMNLYNEDIFVEDKGIPINLDFMFLYPEGFHPEFKEKILSGKYNSIELYEMSTKKEYEDYLKLPKIVREGTCGILNKIEDSLLDERKIFKQNEDIHNEKFDELLEKIKNNSDFPLIVGNNIYDKDLADKITEDGKANLQQINDIINNSELKNIVESFKDFPLPEITENNNLPKIIICESDEDIDREFKHIKNLDESIFIKNKVCVICQNCKSFFLKPIEECSECRMKSFQLTDGYNKKFAKNLKTLLDEYRNENKILNINEPIKFIPNEKGIQQIYNHFNRHLENTKYEFTLQMILDKIDLETGQYEMQLWEFINCFGGPKSMLGNGFDGPFKENNIFIHKSKFKN